MQQEHGGNLRAADDTVHAHPSNEPQTLFQWVPKKHLAMADSHG
jgi:hypothetical protein